MKNTFIIVIPIYNETPKSYENIALTQLGNIIKNKHYNVCAIYPIGMCTDNYNQYNYITEWKPTNGYYFKNTETYSQLLLSQFFYDRFADYDMMYIFQTDVYIFKDDFQKYANYNFDYIGAPIIGKDSDWKHVPQVGNGGFSLRKISTFQDMLDVNTLHAMGINEVILNEQKYEDLFICDTLKYKYDLNMPTVQDAFKFAWDRNVEYIYNNITKELPMAAHWFNHQLYFWEKIIPELNKIK